MRGSIHTGRGRLCLALAVLLALLTGCGASVAAVDEALRDELGREFGDELRDYILPNKDSKSLLREYGVYVVEEGYVNEFDTLRSFAGNAGANLDCALTVAHYSTSFVMSRIVFSGGVGYYYRFEYDRFNEDKIELDFKAVQSVELEELDEFEKCELTLRYGGNSYSLLTFRLDDGVNLPGTFLPEGGS